jgi:hypothetical protein
MIPFECQQASQQGLHNPALIRSAHRETGKCPMLRLIAKRRRANYRFEGS